MEVKETQSARDAYNELVEQFNGDTEKIKEHIDNRLVQISEMTNEWGKFVMTSFWGQVKNHSQSL